MIIELNPDASTQKTSATRIKRKKIRRKVGNFKKFFGVLKFKEDALKIQKKMRNEW